MGTTTTPPAILIVDDEPDLRTTLAMLLVEEFPGCEVVTAETAERGIDHIVARPFDLVITDYALPRLTGVDVAHAAAIYRPGTSCVLVTGLADPRIGEAEMRDGTLRGNLRKTISASELLQTIHGVLGTGPAMSGTAS